MLICYKKDLQYTFYVRILNESLSCFLGISYLIFGGVNKVLRKNEYLCTWKHIETKLGKTLLGNMMNTFHEQAKLEFIQPNY